jgi:hypothetical protein
MNTGVIRSKLRVCKRCDSLCEKCPHALPCAMLGQRVRPTECYICWHNEGTALPRDCRVRNRTAAKAAGPRPHSHTKRF